MANSGVCQYMFTLDLKNWGGQKLRRNIKIHGKLNIFTIYVGKIENLQFSPNKALAAEGFLLAFYRIALLFQDFPSSSGELGYLERKGYLSPAANSYFFQIFRRRQGN